MPVQKDGVEGRADEAGKDADRHLSYTQRPGRGVHEQQEDAAHKARGGNEFGVIRPYTHTSKMRDDQAAASRRKFRYRFNEAYVSLLAVQTFRLPRWKAVYALRPIIVGLLPMPLYQYLHRRKMRGST